MTQIVNIRHKWIPLMMMVFLCLTVFRSEAQQPAAPSDSMNTYQQMIFELENRGVNVMHLLEDKKLTDKLWSEFGISADSLLFYYEKKYADLLDGEEDAIQEEESFIAMMGKSYGDSIVLRWAPSTKVLADSVYERGFTVIRIAMMEDENGLVTLYDPSPNSLRILADSANPIRPWTLEEVESRLPDPENLSGADSLAVIAAWTLYGSMDSSTTQEDSSAVAAKSKEDDMLFGISLLMADRSSLAAELLGLRFADSDLEPGKHYKYIIHPVGFPPEMAASTIVVNDPSRNEVVKDLKIKEDDGYLTLYWPKRSNAYSGYWIERSADNGETWSRMTKQPVVFVDFQSPKRSLESNDNEENELNERDHYIFRDTVENYKKYFYRVSGQTPFADYTDYVSVSGMATDLTPPPIPVILEHYVDEETGIGYIDWGMNSDASTSDLAGFTIWSATHPDSTFEQVSGMLPVSARSYRSPAPLSNTRTHYYVVKSVDDKGNAMSSFPIYMHVIDDVPPLSPTGLSYLIDDSTGIVTLSWDANEEADLSGYKVFFSNSLKDEFSQLTHGAQPGNVFYDTLALVTLSEEVYYKVRAEDLSYNGSGFSDVLTVKRPDHVPPVAPVMEIPEIHEGYIRLKWRTSSSIDVERQIIYRRLLKEEQEWLALADLEDPALSQFDDMTATEEAIYEYSMRVVDDAGLYSAYAFPVRARRWFDGSIAEIQNLNVVYNSETGQVDMQWEYEAQWNEILEDVDYMFYIYRSKGDEEIKRYRLLDSETLSFSDSRVSESDTYNYGVKVVYLDGKAGPMSRKAIEVSKE